MTIKELINLLSKHPDQNLPVFYFNKFNDEISSVDIVDFNLTDRVDLQSEED